VMIQIDCAAAYLISPFAPKKDAFSACLAASTREGYSHRRS
jgi:hypothetical protein